MPELPDVEVFRRYASRTALNRKIKGVTVTDQRILGEVSQKQLNQKLVGKKFTTTKRVGKYLFLKVPPRWLFIHFGMTGFLESFDQEPPKHARVIFDFPDQKFAIISQRLLGKVDVIDSIEELVQEKGLGTDAREITYGQFCNLISQAKGKVKSFLMDQGSIAGIGNIYADEILFQSGIHPAAPVRKLEQEQIKKLFRNTSRVLEMAIKKQADPDRFPRSYLIPRREQGDQCPKCKSTIQMVRINNRSAYFCPKCQRK